MTAVSMSLLSKACPKWQPKTNLMVFRYFQINAQSKRDQFFYANCYKMLDLENGSNQDLVRNQYIKLAKMHHPDQAGIENRDKFLIIDQAYRELMKKFAADKRKEEKCSGEYGLFYEETETAEANYEHPDIEHTAPQHRQYLDNHGFGYGTPFQRQKQFQRFKAARASERVIEHSVKKLTSQYETQVATTAQKNSKRAKRQITKNAMERLVEDLISESMSKGDFDNLSGAGKPLPQRVIYNPYEDFTTHKMNQILVEGGFAPEWIMLKKDIDKMVDDLRQDLDKAFFKQASGVATSCEEKWKAFCHATFAEVSAINKTIDKYNLMVPMMRSQKFHIDLDKEASKCWARNWSQVRSSSGTDRRNDNVNNDKDTDQVISNSSLLKRLADFMINKVKS